MNIASIQSSSEIKRSNLYAMITGCRRANIKFDDLPSDRRAIIEFIMNQMSALSKRISDKEFYFIAKLVSGRISTNTESIIDKHVINVNATCYCTSDVAVYAGAALAFARLCIKAERNAFHTITRDEVISCFVSCMQEMGVECVLNDVETGLVIKQDLSGKGGSLSGYNETLNSLGYLPGENKTVDRIAKKLPTNEALAEIHSLGIPPQPVRKALLSAISNGLEGIWPVDVPYYPYSVNFSGETGSASPDWEAAGMSAASKLFNTIVDVGGEYAKSQIKTAQDQAEVDMKIKAAKELGISASSVSNSQLNAWASANPNDAANIAANALKNSGVTQQQIDSAKAALEKSETTKKYLMYGGAAVGGVALIGLVIYAMRRK